MSTSILHQTQFLADLFHRRWAAPILAELHRDRGAKFITLQRRLEISPDSLRRTLDDLCERELIARNPGYGHPLRPEYILRPEGLALGPGCFDLMKIVRRRSLDGVALRKWSMPVTYALHAPAERFSELRRLIPDATPRALTESLRSLADSELVHRAVEDGYPPRPRYQLSRTGRALLPPLIDLASVHHIAA